MIYVDISILLLQFLMLAISAPKLFPGYEDASARTIDHEELGQNEETTRLNSGIVADINVLERLKAVWEAGTEV